MAPAAQQRTEEVESKPAPALLDRIQILVNSLDLETGQDCLAAPEPARRWLVEHRWLAPDVPLDPADLEAVREVREALRGMLVHNAGGPAPRAEAVAVLRDIAAQGTVRAQVGDDGEVLLGAAGTGLRAGLVEVFLIVRDAQRSGTWGRLKACANDDCRWAFYDRSKNRCGAWCTMAVCGNRLKNRDFRARRRG